MLGFGQAVRIWRAHRGLSQAQLARAAGLSRPNLSAIERGRREVTLGTLRALAVALEVAPGILADGTPPQLPGDPAALSRQALERIADGVARGRPVRSELERTLVELLRHLTKARRRLAFGSGGLPRVGSRAEATSWLRLKAACPPAVLRTLLERIDDRLRLYGTQTH
jgi:transcriptional regulator with XRE-family HTH domain